MYVSRAVQSIRADPIEGEPITLVVETADGADAETITEAIRQAGGSIERRLQFDDLEIEVPQERVGEVCEIDGLTAVQTADAIGVNPDEVEEDLDPEQ